MKNHQLKALVQVAESGSIRAAARTMNLCQSALTKALRELEEDVGAELLTRSYKGIEFTSAGHTLLARARLAMALLDKACEEINLQRGGVGVRVSIAVTPLVGVQVLPKVLTEFERLYPAAQINLGEGLLTSLLPQLIDGRLDFAVALADPNDLPFEIVFEPIVPIYSWVAGRQNHPLSGAKTWDDLKDAKWVLNLTAGSQGNSLLAWMKSQNITEPRNIIRCDSPLLMLELMQRTDRLCVGPALLFADPMIGQGLARVNVEPLPPPMSLGLITLRGIPLQRPARQLASLINRHLRHGSESNQAT